MGISKSWHPSLLLWSVLLSTGCSEFPNRIPIHPAQGKLIYQGRPAIGAIVILHPLDTRIAQTLKPRGKVGTDGSYQLTTYESGDGAPEGDFFVTIYWPKSPPFGEPNNDDGPDLLKGKYLQPDKPAGKFTIRKGPNELGPLELK